MVSREAQAMVAEYQQLRARYTSLHNECGTYVHKVPSSLNRARLQQSALHRLQPNGLP